MSANKTKSTTATRRSLPRGIVLSHAYQLFLVVERKNNCLCQTHRFVSLSRKQKCCAISLPSHHLHLILGDAEAFPNQSQVSYVFCVFQIWPKHTWELFLRILSNLMPEPPQLVIFVAKKLPIYSMSVSWITELFTLLLWMRPESL